MKRGENLKKYDHTGPTYRTQPREYRVWSSMLTRCCNPKFKDWHLYGGRGITVCEEWMRSFAAFFQHVGPRPSRQHSIDRFPNGDGNYEPGNVRWATASEQCRHFSRNRNITYKGETLPMVAWSERTGLKREVIADRLNRGWSVHRTLTTPTVEMRSRARNGRYA